MSLTWAKLSNELSMLAAAKKLPLTGKFELTSRCNLQCKMCYVCKPLNDAQAAERELRTTQWIKLAEEARDAGVLYLTLTGGEVLVRKDFKTIYEEISNMGFNLQVYTNGTMITPEIGKMFGRVRPSKVSITIYGASPDTYHKVTGYADGYNRTLRGIDILLDQGVVVELKTTVVKGNMDDFDKIAALAEERKLEFGIVNYISPRRECGNSDPLGNRLNPEELALYEAHARDYNLSRKALDEQFTAELNNEMYEENSILGDKSDTRERDNASAFKCLAGKCGFWVTWDGRMTPCGLLDKPEVFPLRTSFQESWKELLMKTAEIPVCNECQDCPLKAQCMSCPARLMNETGAYDKPAPYLCESAKNRLLHVCK